MTPSNNANTLSHRSRERVRDLGEVFTPEAYVESMLQLLADDKSSKWSDESQVFFEPSCGHGNIVLPVYKKRLEAIYKQAQSRDLKNPALYAVANSLSTLWALDIDSKNISQCKSRLLLQTLEFLKNKTGNKSAYQLISKNEDFFAHLLCTLNWQIQENETLSALSTPEVARNNASQTKIGLKWFSKNGHKEIDFDFPWSFFFKESVKDNVLPLEFSRATKYLSNLLKNSKKTYEEFDFASSVILDQIQFDNAKATRMEA